VQVIKKLVILIYFGFPSLLFGQHRNHVFISSDCQSDNEIAYNLNERLIEKVIANDSIKISIGVQYACCTVFKSSYEFNGANLFLTFENTGDQCFCSCFYKLTYKIPLNGRKEVGEIIVNGEDLPITNQKYAEFNVKSDTLSDGSIRIRKYRNSVITYQILITDTLRTYQFFRNGEYESETKIRVK